MELIVGGRQTGRTTELLKRCEVKYLAGEPFYVVGAHKHIEKIVEQRFGREHVLSPDSIRLGGLRGVDTRRTALYVDDIDTLIIHALNGNRPTAATFWQDEPWTILPSYDPRRDTHFHEDE